MTTQEPAAASARLRLIGVVAAVASLLCAAGTAVAGVVLARSYRPRAPGVEVALMPAALRRSETWSDWHVVGSTLLVLCAAVVVGVVIGSRFGVRSWSTGRAALGASVVTVAAGVATVFTRPLVQFDQLALWAVTTGSNVSGYWYAAFDDGVRFILLGGAEVHQDQYAPALMVHLFAPVIAALGAGVSAVTLWRAREHDGVDLSSSRRVPQA